MLGPQFAPPPIRTPNQRAVLRQLLVSGPTSRSEIALATGLTEAAVSRITRELIARGLIREGDKAAGNGPGRRQVRLEFGSDGAFVVGLGITGYEQRITVANLQGGPVAARRLALASMKDRRRALEQFADEILRALDEGGISGAPVLGVGVAVAGTVDHRSGLVIDSPNLGWERLDLGGFLRARLRLPVYVDSLMNAMNLAGAGATVYSGMPNVLLVNVALGIGASVLADGRLVRGAAFGAGQIGHLRVEGSNDLCVCGRRGCLDTVASGRAVLTRLGLLAPVRDPAEEEHVERDAEGLFRSLSKREADSDRIAETLRDAGEGLGRVVGAAVATIDPAMIRLTGFVAEDERYLVGVRAGLEWFMTRRGDPLVPIQVARIGSDQAAVRLALDRFAFALPPEEARTGVH